MNTTTIQVSVELKKFLDKLKLFERETYSDVIERLIEDEMEISEETKKEIEISLKQIKEGKYKTHEEVGKELGFK